MRPVLVIAVAIVMGFLAGCSARSHVLAPPRIHYGQVACARCGMIVDDPRFAAACTAPDGRTTRIFDDIGDMLAWQAEHPEEKSAVAWVHDFETRSWLSADTARYVVGTRITTPMGRGAVALADDARARAVAARYGGRVVALREARQTIARAGGAPDRLGPALAGPHHRPLQAGFPERRLP